jgi:3-hydroxyacyl-CoA dehydrogenase
MQRLKPGIDIVKDILEATVEAQPLSSFAKSLLHQYIERGGLSRKQLEGLYDKALKVPAIPPQKLATLEAIILKKPTRYKSEKPIAAPLVEKDTMIVTMMDTVLAKYPQHKRVVYLKARYQDNHPLSPAEKTELEKFYKLCK